MARGKGQRKGPQKKHPSASGGRGGKKKRNAKALRSFMLPKPGGKSKTNKKGRPSINETKPKQPSSRTPSHNQGRPKAPAAKSSLAPGHPWQDEKPSPDLMRRIMAECGFEVDDLQLNQLWQYYLRLKERNQEINLTRIRRFPDIVVKHYVDCAMVGKLTKLKGPILDIGSGPGFPGVPLKILHPDLPVVLCEGRRVRVEFLEEVRRCLRLPSLYIYGHQLHPTYTEPMAAVVTRALEVIPKTLNRVSGCLQKGGHAIFMKGPNVDPEIKEVAETMKNRYRLVADHDYLLPSTDNQRRLVIFKRLDSPPKIPENQKS